MVAESLKKRFRADPLGSWMLLVLALGIIARFAITFLVTPSGDSYLHLNTARFIAENMRLPLFEPIYRPFFYYPPLFHLSTAAIYTIFSVFGSAVATKAMDFVAPLFGSISLILFYYFSQMLVDRRRALYAQIFLAFVPIHVYYSTIAHVDIAAMCLVLFIMYAVMRGPTTLAGLAGGMGMLTKYTVMFIFPTVILAFYQRSKATLTWLRSLGIFFGLTLLAGLPLYIRNLVHLGNPMWPFLNNIAQLFGLTPLLVETRPEASLAHLSELLIAPVRAYLDFFGVPLGIPGHLLSLPVPVIIIWVSMTLLFIAPLIIGLFVKKPKDLGILTSVWIGTYLVMLLYYIYDFGAPFFRITLPMFPALALIWAYGYGRIVDSLPSKRKILAYVLLALLCIGFVGAEFIKPQVAKVKNKALYTDLDWINENIPRDQAVFATHDLAIIYHTRHEVVSMLREPSDYQGDVYHYLSPLMKEEQQDLAAYQGWEVVYDNPATGGKVLKRP